MRFKIFSGSFSASVFVDSLTELLWDLKEKVFMIPGGYPVHRSRLVNAFLETRLGRRLRLFFLPPYSPELNPDEQVWNDLKNIGIGRQIIAGPNDLREKSEKYFFALRRSPDRIRKFFQLKKQLFQPEHVGLLMS